MKIIMMVFLLFVSVKLLQGQISYNTYVASIVDQVNADSLYRYERQLCGDLSSTIGGSSYTIASRHYTKEGNSKAAQYIFERFQSFGLTTSYQVITSSLTNVLGRKTGYKYPNQYLIICAHYDNMPSTTSAPGADDNATGTAAVIEAARVIKNKSFPFTVVFAAWDEEERGLYGSKAYADTARRLNDSIIAVLNFDMIGYDGNNDGALDINTNTASSWLANDFFQCVQIYQPTLVPQITYSLNGGSDHQSFQQKNYSAILSIEDNSDFTPYYHTVNDTYASLNKPYFLKMTKAGVSALATLAANLKNTVQLDLLAGIEGFWNGSSQVRDSIKVNLRMLSSPFAIADSRTVYTDNLGGSFASFDNATNGSYYIQVIHRNALETWSSAPVSFTKGTVRSYDFTTGSGTAYGNNLVLKSGRYCFYSGDVNADGVVDGADGSEIDNAAFEFLPGYQVYDLNGDNITDGSDLSIADNNSSVYVQVRRP